MSVWILRAGGIFLDDGRGRPVRSGRIALDILFAEIRSPERAWPRERGGARAELMGRLVGESPPQGDGPGSVPLAALRRIRRTG